MSLWDLVKKIFTILFYISIILMGIWMFYMSFALSEMRELMIRYPLASYIPSKIKILYGLIFGTVILLWGLLLLLNEFIHLGDFSKKLISFMNGIVLILCGMPIAGGVWGKPIGVGSLFSLIVGLVFTIGGIVIVYNLLRKG